MFLCLDIECTTYEKGNPYSLANKLVSIHATDGVSKWSFRPEQREQVQDLVNQTSTFIWFNAKFDIAWLRLLGIIFPTYSKHYDVQLAHFYITSQQHKLPSLNEVAEYYKLPGKVDKVKEFWDRGVDTPDIPWDILCEYGEQDVALTHQIFTLQQDYWLKNPKKYILFKLACQDMLILQDMEWNGLCFDEELCHQKSQELQTHIKQLTDKLSSVYPDIPINFNSSQQLSAFLYGGTIKEDGKELVGFYKGGQKQGQPKYKNVIIEHTLPCLFTPLPKTQMATPGVFSTDEGTLRKLKGKHRHLVDTLLELAKLTKLNETYYIGLTKLRKEKAWAPEYLHPTYSQCIAKTGRLSSSTPNAQNMSGDALEVFITRYA